MKEVRILLLFLMVCTKAAVAQHKCAFDETAQAVAAKYPAVQKRMNELKQATPYRAAAKTSATEPYTIPLVFHFVVNQQQLNALGGDSGIRQRIDSQLIVLNRDFNAENADSINIPGGFKPLFGDVNIRFALAHTDPFGRPTKGYDVKVITHRGFEIENGIGSGFGFSDVKYVSSGGVDAWDVETYLNIWVMQPLEDGAGSNVLGLAIPEYFAAQYSMPVVEQGIVLHFAAIGKRRKNTDVYIQGSDAGRTLTHEVGHFFELLHIWGDDDGKCPNNGGADDGISDTPPQAYSSSNCLVYPETDGCTRTGDGIMFMNYMDYSDDVCALMFTKEQASRMQSTWQIGKNLYSLTQHPWVLEYPADSNSSTVKLNAATIYPNPADGIVNISYRLQTSSLKQIMIIDLLGGVVLSQPVDNQAAFYSVRTATLQAGIYFLVLHKNSGKEVHRILIR